MKKKIFFLLPGDEDGSPEGVGEPDDEFDEDDDDEDEVGEEELVRMPPFFLIFY